MFLTSNLRKQKRFKFPTNWLRCSFTVSCIRHTVAQNGQKSISPRTLSPGSLQLVFKGSASP